MTTLQKLQYAQSRLAMAKMMGDTTAEIAKWQEHVAYWMEQRRQELDKQYTSGNGWHDAWKTN